MSAENEDGYVPTTEIEKEVEEHSRSLEGVAEESWDTDENLSGIDLTRYEISSYNILDWLNEQTKKSPLPESVKEQLDSARVMAEGLYGSLQTLKTVVEEARASNRQLERDIALERKHDKWRVPNDENLKPEDGVS